MYTRESYLTKAVRMPVALHSHLACRFFLNFAMKNHPIRLQKCEPVMDGPGMCEPQKSTIRQTSLPQGDNLIIRITTSLPGFMGGEPVLMGGEPMTHKKRREGTRIANTRHMIT